MKVNGMTDLKLYPSLNRSSRGLQFARRLLWPRTFGTILSFIAIASVLIQQNAPDWQWALLAINGLLWPHIAWSRVVNRQHHYSCELSNLKIDAFSVAFWIPMINFNLLPTAAITSMLLMSMISIGGVRMIRRMLLPAILGVTTSTLLHDPRWLPDSSALTVLSSLPLVICFPLCVGIVSHKLAKDLSKQKRSLQVISRQDGLSELYNRAYWELCVSDMYQRLKSSNDTASLILIDVDHFKNINDTYGHTVGDDVIRGLASIIRRNLRAIDITGRYGGEEFGILLPGASIKEASKVAERIRVATAITPMCTEHSVFCTISLGVKEFSADYRSHKEWITGVDEALYNAKHNGRNRVSTANIAELPQTA